MQHNLLSLCTPKHCPCYSISIHQQDGTPANPTMLTALVGVTYPRPSHFLCVTLVFFQWSGARVRENICGLLKFPIAAAVLWLDYWNQLINAIVPYRALLCMEQQAGRVFVKEKKTAIAKIKKTLWKDLGRKSSAFPAPPRHVRDPVLCRSADAWTPNSLTG